MSLYNLLIWMICIRLFFYGLICSFFACFSVFVCCAIASGQGNLITEHQETLERIPNGNYVKKFLKKKSRKFNPNDHEC